MARPEDTILEDLVNRGIGVSGLTSRAIGQANLPDLRSSINTSISTLENQQKDRLSQIRRQVGLDSSRIDIRDRGGDRAGGPFDPSAPSAFINIFGDSKNPAASYSNNGQSPIRDSKGRAFRITYADGGNLKAEKDFASLGELLDFTKDPRFKGTQLRLSGTPSSIDDNESRMLEQYGIAPISVGAARQTVNSFVKPGYDLKVRSNIGGGFSIKEKAARDEEYLNERKRLRGIGIGPKPSVGLQI